MKARATKMKAEAMHTREGLSMERPGDAQKIRKLDRVIHYVTGINRIYWLVCCILVFVLTGLFYSIYPDLHIAFVWISLFLGFVCWTVIWLSIILQIKLWNKAINKIHAG